MGFFLSLLSLSHSLSFSLTLPPLPPFLNCFNILLLLGPKIYVGEGKEGGGGLQICCPGCPREATAVAA